MVCFPVFDGFPILSFELFADNVDRLVLFSSPIWLGLHARDSSGELSLPPSERSVPRNLFRALFMGIGELFFLNEKHSFLFVSCYSSLSLAWKLDRKGVFSALLIWHTQTDGSLASVYFARSCFRIQSLSLCSDAFSSHDDASIGPNMMRMWKNWTLFQLISGFPNSVGTSLSFIENHSLFFRMILFWLAPIFLIKLDQNHLADTDEIKFRNHHLESRTQKKHWSCLLSTNENRPW